MWKVITTQLENDNDMHIDTDCRTFKNRNEAAACFFELIGDDEMADLYGISEEKYLDEWYGEGPDEERHTYYEKMLEKGEELLKNGYYCNDDPYNCEEYYFKQI